MSTSSPLVSVIIPVYKRADFLNQAVASVMDQTFTDFELIVVDDDSGDDIVRQFRLPESARLIRRTSNCGYAAMPRNDGYRVSRGRYIAFLDMDDVWLPEKLARQVAILEAHPEVGVAVCHCTFVDEALKPIRKQRSVPAITIDPLKQLIHRCFIRTPGLTLIRREALEKSGLFDEAMMSSEDWDLWLRLARVTAFHVDPAPDVLYRKHSGQHTANNYRIRKAQVAVLEKVRTWVGDEHPDLLPCVHRQLAMRYSRLAGAQFKHQEAFQVVLSTLNTAFRYSPLCVRACRVYLAILAVTIMQAISGPKS